MGLADKLIQRLEEQAETLAEYRQRDEKHRGRIYDLEGQLVRAASARDNLASTVETLRQENEKLKIELNCRQQKGGE